MQGQQKSDYFVRLGASPPGSDPAPRAPAHERPMHERYASVEEELPPPRRRRRRITIRPLYVLGAIVLGWLVWAAMSPGGVSARIDDISDSVQGLLDDATTDPGLKRAANYYNQEYERSGSYPQLSQSDIDDDPDAGWGVGVTVEWCSPNAIVLHSLTGRGTISRLLLAGQDLGDVPQKQACPADLSDPQPWSAKG